MKKLATFIIFATFCSSALSAAAQGHCRKCEIMNKYNKEHPSNHEYYEDYLKDLKEKGAEGVDPSVEDLPQDVKQIMKQEKVKAKEPIKKS